METVALFTYGSGCSGKQPGGKVPPGALSQPCLVNTGCGLPNNTSSVRSNSTLTNTIYKPTSLEEEKHIRENNTLAVNPRTASPITSPPDLATSPAKVINGSDKCDTIYGTLRKEMPTLKAVPPPTIPPSSITPTQTPMLPTRSKKTVTICDSAEVGRAASPLSPERI